MKKKVWRNIILYGLILVTAAYFIPREKNWRHSYSLQHAWPYGCEILQAHLSDVFPEYEVSVNEESLYQIQDSLIGSQQNMIFVEDYLEMDSLDLAVLLRHVASGAEVLLAAMDLPNQLLDTLQLDIASHWSYNNSISKNNRDTVFHNFYHEQLSQRDDYLIYSEYYTNYFVSEDSLDQYHGLAFAEDSLTIFIAKDFGKGKFYLHSHPLAFTNYYMMQPRGRDYLSKILSHMTSRNLIWDEKYKHINTEKKGSTLKVILAEAPLKWAYYLLVFTALLFALFMIKRRQRVIPVIDHYPNESKELVETIGNLYFNTSDNKTLAAKKVKLFYQNMQRKYGMRPDWEEERQKQIIQQKTSYPADRLQRLFTLMENIQLQEKVSDGQLKVLNKYINELNQDQID